MPHYYERRQELEARISELRALIARREAQGSQMPIIESAREQLRTAEQNLAVFDGGLAR